VRSDVEERTELGRKEAPQGQMTHDEPGPGRTYALQARKSIKTLRKRKLTVETEIQWCPAHEGIPGNEIDRGRVDHTRRQ